MGLASLRCHQTIEEDAPLVTRLIDNSKHGLADAIERGVDSVALNLLHDLDPSSHGRAASGGGGVMRVHAVSPQFKVLVTYSTF